MYGVLRIRSFALQAILRVEPALAGQPVALAVPGRRGALIEETNSEAEAAGVPLSVSVPQAQARCPRLIVRARRPDLEEEATAALHVVAFAVTAYVEATSPGICTLGLGQLPAPRHLPALERALRQLAALGLPASAGLAATPLLALYAARQAEAGRIMTGDRAFLGTLPVATAEPPPELAKVLAAWGVRTLGELTALPKADVTARLGREGLALWERAAGATTRPLAVIEPSREFAARFESEHEMETLEPLLFVLRRFVDRLALELANAHLAALEIGLELFLADGPAYVQSIRLPEPATDADVVFRILQTHLETVRTSAPVTGLRLKLRPGRIRVRQQGLFDGGLRDPHGFAETLARVVALMGSDRVGRPVPADTFRPDAFTLRAPLETLPMLPERFMHPPQGLPLRRYRPPVSARVAESEGRPAWVWAAGVEGGVAAAAGPWLSSGGWWEKECFWHHGEWDIELATGGLYRLRHTAGGWFVEGEYD